MISVIKSLLTLSVLSTLAAAKFESATPPIEVVGNKFYYSNNGTQFLLRGIAYQQDTSGSVSNGYDSDPNRKYNDPLADADACKRDVQYFIDTNTNTLRVYGIDPDKDHEECMKIFSDAGIYVIADLSEPTVSVNRINPEWNLDLYERYTKVIDNMQEYSNVLGFFAGNEVTNNRTNTDASPFVKAAVRDMKKYIKDNDYRTIPVGYSSNDDEDTRVAIADYFACGSLDDRADFFGINMYEWCGRSTFATSGYKDRTEDFKNLTIPIFFSEYGCNEVSPRVFQEVGTLYSDQMTDVWSGGIVYMYYEEANHYGLVSLNGDRVSTLADYNNYKSAIKSISPSLARRSTIQSEDSTKTMACPDNSHSTWRASTELPPTPDEEFCDCISQSFNCVVADDVDAEDYSTLFGEVCGYIDCGDISANGNTGEYGGFSFCSDKDRLSYVLNQYYHDQNERADACDFAGSASINDNASASTSCSAAGGRGLQSGRRSSTTRGGSSSSRSSSSSSSSSTGSGSSNAGIKVGGGQMSTVKLITITTIVTAFVGGLSIIFY
uniref:Protein EPD2 n=1 Tax=Candida maltosa TaxID=5479 RepID=EPD2_CANMA|nr:RecName: Full=Protein EPD2; AltName: Full=Essential for pseudohyphal development 2; Flags: Precursor [Candida maltosa]BAA32730.1 EPD2 [Candida maltosa]